ncbi:hypothetical protein KW784_00690 [Candidatus Parcubacteria bacterium]|nr:hypothetical protein [Candidatus Parcubacteria bacterium]
MPPKFQSSFIPHGPQPAAGVIPQAAPAHQRDLLAFIAKAIFSLSILAAIAAVGYKLYLGYSIRKMGAELEATRQEVSTGVTGELIRLNDRIVSTEALLQSHRVLSPLFGFLEASTPKSVRFSEFSYLDALGGPQVILKGQAKTYAALSLEADVIYKNKDFTNPVFSDIRLDDKGNVNFSLKAGVSPELISYGKTVGRAGAFPPPVPGFVPPIVPPATNTATTKSASTTPKATSTATH